jgi:hypothetical protein
MQELLRTLHDEGQVQLVDCLGPLDDATRRWTTRSYSEGQMLLAPRSVRSQLLWGAYRCGSLLRELAP